jgi:hypothetical protein
VLDLSSIDLEEIASALSDQNDYEHHWLINPDSTDTQILPCPEARNCWDRRALMPRLG